jgi:hypothetical protein
MNTKELLKHLEKNKDYLKIKCKLPKKLEKEVKKIKVQRELSR